MESGNDITAAVLVIGDEILSGRTKDRNVGLIADHLTSIGIRLIEVRVVRDNEDAIVDAVNALRERATYLFTTGGIGPTHDDITAGSVARAFGVAIGLDPRAETILQAYYDGRGLLLTDARRRMARIPAGADLIPNSVSGAPGIRLGNTIVMAGVPEIMIAMLHAVTPSLRTGLLMRSLTLRVRCPESEIAERLAAVQRAFPDVAMGSYPRLLEGRPIADLVMRSTDEERLAAAAQDLSAAIGHELID